MNAKAPLLAAEAVLEHRRAVDAVVADSAVGIDPLVDVCISDVELVSNQRRVDSDQLSRDEVAVDEWPVRRGLGRNDDGDQ